MSKATEVEFQGEKIPAEELDFEIEKEPWAVYRLEDGTVLRLKQVLVRVARTNRYKPDGEPIYVFEVSGVAHTNVPPSLKKNAD